MGLLNVACLAVITVSLAGKGYALDDWDWYNDCGGVIPISTIHLARISYKYGTNYDPSEFCVWTLLPHDGVTSVMLDIYRNNAGSTPTTDGLIAYSWNSTGLVGYKIPLPTTNTLVKFDFPLAFLTFSSGCCEESGGIIVGIMPSGSQGPTTGRAYHIKNEEEGEFKYPEKGSLQEYYGDNDRVSIVIMRQHQDINNAKMKEVKLQDVDIEAGFDSVAVYELGGYWQNTHELMGNVTGYKDASFSLNGFYPMLFLFTSDAEGTGKGFTIRWRDFPSKVKP